MYYALIDNGEIVKYPYTPTDLRFDNLGTSFPAQISDDLMAEFGAVLVLNTPQPDITSSQIVELGNPILIDGQWHQQWVIRDLTAEELKARVPIVVSMRQARLALLQSGLLSAVNAAIDAAETAVQIEWEYATEVQRNNALVQSLSEALNLTETQVDELFTLAASF